MKYKKNLTLQDKPFYRRNKKIIKSFNKNLQFFIIKINLQKSKTKLNKKFDDSKNLSIYNS